MSDDTPSFDAEEPLAATAGALPATVEPDRAGAEERNWAMLCHLSTYAGFLVPFANILAPLVVWAIKREDNPLVDDQGKEAMNFQISITLYVLIALLFSLILIGIPFLLGLLLADLVLTLIAAVKAADGEAYRYPITLRLIR
jgi:uncharacterized Tic20 family protein